MTKIAFALASTLLAIASAAANPLETIDVLCGGVAAEDRERVAKEVRGATITLEFYSGTQGNYVADVDVLFSPIAAPVKAFGIVTTGPHCLVELPPGEYVVYTWFNGHSRSTRATIPAAPSQPVRVALGFPEHSGKDAMLVPISAGKATP